MSEILIRMKAPKNGFDCPLCKGGMCQMPSPDSDGICLTYGPEGPDEVKRPADCPLRPLPEHGKLIDADTLKTLMIEVLEGVKEHPIMDGYEKCLVAAIDTLGQMIDDAPTVIPASNRDELSQAGEPAEEET